MYNSCAKNNFHGLKTFHDPRLKITTIVFGAKRKLPARLSQRKKTNCGLIQETKFANLASQKLKFGLGNRCCFQGTKKRTGTDNWPDYHLIHFDDAFQRPNKGT